jgi:hypothetical protein
MRYPYERYLSFLVSRKADVNGTLTKLRLPTLSPKELHDRNFLAEKAPPSVKKYIMDGNISVSKQFMSWTESHGIRELWEIQPEFRETEHRVKTAGSDDMASACRIFAVAEHRTALSLMIMRSFELDDIVDAFEQHYNLAVTEEMLVLYQKYFFDTTGMTRKDWFALIHALPEDQASKLTTGLRGSKEMVEYAVGKMPKVTFEHILHDIMVSSYYKYRALVNQPLMDQLAMKWADQAMAAGEKKAKYTKGDRTDILEDIQLRFEFEEPEFPTITELSTPDK